MFDFEAIYKEKICQLQKPLSMEQNATVVIQSIHSVYFKVMHVGSFCTE